MTTFFFIYFKDRSRPPLRFMQRVWHTRDNPNDVSGWYVYPSPTERPVVVLDSDIAEVVDEDQHYMRRGGVHHG